MGTTPTTLTFAFVFASWFAGAQSQPTEDFARPKDVPHGVVDRRPYDSTTTRAKRYYSVYTPPAYATDPDKRYPVLYLLHGAGSNEYSWPSVGAVRDIMDNLIAEKKATPMIVVMPNGYATRPGEAPPKPPAARGGRPDFNKMFVTFGEDLVNDLIPNVDKEFRTLKNRDSRALAGLSMGGFQTFTVGLGRLDLFSTLGGFSGCGGAFGAPIDLKKDYKGALDDATAFNARMNLVFLSVGTKEPEMMLDSVKRFKNALTAQGIKFRYFEVEGATHDWPTWRRSLLEFAPLLFKPDALPNPRVAFAQKISPAADDRKIFPDPPAGFDVVRPGIPHGKLEPSTWESNTVGKARRMLVYTPPGYTSKRKYPVLYLLHGIGANEYQWGWAGKPDVVLDNLIADGKAKPMIVVMPNGCAQKDDEPKGNVFASAPAYAVFEQDLLDDLMPTIESRYSVEKSPRSRAIAGLSMGGGQSLNFGFGNMKVFGSIGAFSAAPNTYSVPKLVPDLKAAKAMRLIYLSVGTKDGLFGISQRTHQYLRDNHVPHVWNVDGHGHDRETWSANLYQFLQKVFK